MSFRRCILFFLSVLLTFSSAKSFSGDIEGNGGDLAIMREMLTKRMVEKNEFHLLYMYSVDKNFFGIGGIVDDHYLIIKFMRAVDKMLPLCKTVLGELSRNTISEYTGIMSQDIELKIVNDYLFDVNNNYVTVLANRLDNSLTINRLELRFAMTEGDFDLLVGHELFRLMNVNDDDYLYTYYLFKHLEYYAL